MKDTNAKQQYTTLANNDHMPSFVDGNGDITYYAIAPIYAEGFAKAVSLPSGKPVKAADSSGQGGFDGYWLQLTIDGSNVYSQQIVEGDLGNSNENPLIITFREVDYCTADGKKYKMIVLCSEAYEDQQALEAATSSS